MGCLRTDPAGATPSEGGSVPGTGSAPRAGTPEEMGHHVAEFMYLVSSRWLRLTSMWAILCWLSSTVLREGWGPSLFVALRS